MRVLVTGAGGFVGGAVVARLRSRRDAVVAPVRDPSRAGLAAAGAELVRDDLSDVERLTRLLRDCDAVIHAAGSYRVGIPPAERDAMWEANVGTTTRVLDAAQAAATRRIVHVSTVNAYGNTRGTVVDETYRRDLADGFLSWYDETKFRAHEIAEQRAAAGAPVVLVLPSQVYGPGDRSAFGDQLRRAHAGKLAGRALDEVGVGLVHVDDVAAGIVAALDRGEPGRSYVLSGPTTTLGEAIDLAARIGGRRPPRVRIPSRLLRALGLIARAAGRPALHELVEASAGVTYWASAARARRELGFTARPIEEGLRDTFGAA